VTVVLASKLARSAADEDTQQAIERACFCESLAPLLHEDRAELYMLGMLSMMDRMLNIPMKQLLGLVSIDPRIQEALLGSVKGLGRALELCRYHEHGGDSQSLIYPDAFVQDSTSYYFEALLKAGSALHQA
jgi:c-di-GMP-related signal transduction protein